MLRRTLALIVAAVALVSCRPDTIALVYSYPEGSTTTYRMEADANASWDIGGGGSGSYRVVFDITEEVSSDASGNKLVTVTMSPIEVREDGLPSPGAHERTFTLRIGDGSEVAEVVEVDGVEATALDPEEIAFIGTYRPPLPSEAVELHEEWSSTQDLTQQGAFNQVQTTGRLETLDRDEDGRIAELTYTGAGPLTWTTQLPQGEATLTGEATTKTDAVLDIDAGILRSATSSTDGDFEVRVAPRGQQAPIRGHLRFSLDLELERTSG